jgi:hypothetical protein
MLTYRTGAAGAPSAARFMSEHLLQQTLPPEMAVMADYYEQGVAPPTAAEAAASRYAHMVTTEGLLDGARLDATLRDEAARLAESALRADGSEYTPDDLTLRALATLSAAGLVAPDAARARLALLTGSAGDDEAFTVAMESARTARDYSSATARARRDMNPSLAARLGIEPGRGHGGRGLTQSEVAFLLNGQRADGGEIAGKAVQSATKSLREIFGITGEQRPGSVQLANMLAGRQASGEALPQEEAVWAVARFTAAMGAAPASITDEQRTHILAGRRADGSVISDRDFYRAMDASKARIGYIDLTFSAPKSLSVAWAFAPTRAERAMLHQAHTDAIESVLQDVQAEIGRARKGKAGKDGYEPGDIGWVSFDHYAARPTVEVTRAQDNGELATERHALTGTAGRVPGDMQIHTHVAIFNVVETQSGRVGGLDLARLGGRVHEWGAVYQAYLATNLRQHGVAVDLDRKTEMAKLVAVPDGVVAQFSKRTLNGTDAARAFAQSQGLDWDSLTPERKIGLLKSGVQSPREAKTDDVSDLAAWQRTAAAIGYRHRSVLRPEEIVPLPVRSERLEVAYRASLPYLDKQFDHRAVIDGSDIRVAAAKGLIAAGIESGTDVSALTHAYRERGIRRQGQEAALVWGAVKNSQGSDRIAITTTLDEREERILVATAATGAKDRSAALTKDQVEAGVRAFPGLDFTTDHGRAQRHVMDSLGAGGRVGLAVGVAGSGKSTLLKPLVKAWEEDGRTVYGIALAWRQSDDLAEAGIAKPRTRAVASFLAQADRGALNLDKSAVVVVDEVGLLGTRQLNDILAIQKKTGFQLVMIGDPLQMQSVEAGPVIDLLRRALGDKAVPELGSSVRQQTAEEIETTLMFRNGQTAEAIARKAGNDTLKVITGGYREAITGIADLWQERRVANHGRPDFAITVSAPTNQEAHDISAAIRERRRAMGEIGPDQIRIKATDADGMRSYDLALAKGDRVRLFRRLNARFVDTGASSNIGRNGSVLDVASVSETGLSLRSAAGKIGFVPWERLRDPTTGCVQLAYGDALTTNTAQGSTVTEHIHAMPSGSRLVSAFGAYTSGSRHREQNFIVTSEGAERAEVNGRRPLGDRREVTASDLQDNLLRNLSRQPVKEAALDMIDRANSLRRGTINRVQSGLEAMESRMGAGEAVTTLHARFAENRATRSLEQQLPALVERLKHYAERVAEIAEAGTKLTERLVALVRERMNRYETAADYLQRLGRQAKQSTTPPHVEHETKRRHLRP